MRSKVLSSMTSSSRPAAAGSASCSRKGSLRSSIPLNGARTTPARALRPLAMSTHRLRRPSNSRHRHGRRPATSDVRSALGPGGHRTRRVRRSERPRKPIWAVFDWPVWSGEHVQAHAHCSRTLTCLQGWPGSATQSCFSYPTKALPSKSGGALPMMSGGGGSMCPRRRLGPRQEVVPREIGPVRDVAVPSSSAKVGVRS
jgi:hypothetical protein